MTDTEVKMFFKVLGARVRSLRVTRRMTQEDLIDHGFSLRHYQQIEAGHPISVRTLLRLSLAFDIEPEVLLAGIWRETVKRRAPRSGGGNSGS